MASDVVGKTVVITGASSGIGAAAARALAALGACVVPVGRSRASITPISDELGVEPYFADFGRLREVRDLGARLLKDFPTIDVLAHNAGAIHAKRVISEDGFELTMQGNYYSPFLLQHLLGARLSESKGRVIVTSSSGHTAGRIRLESLDRSTGFYSDFFAYGDSKLALILFVRRLAQLAAESGVPAVVFHPGLVSSGMNLKNDSWWTPNSESSLLSRLAVRFTITSEQGAEPLVHFATMHDPETVNGMYFSRMKPSKPSRSARDEKLAQSLWDRTEALLGLG